MKNPRIALKRIYDPPEDGDGTRVLVDRLWPRGVKRADAGIDMWLKDVAPSRTLREWYGHDTDRWPVFLERYASELEQSPEAQEALATLLTTIEQGPVTLLFAARDTEHNNAVALRRVLEQSLTRR